MTIKIFDQSKDLPWTTTTTTTTTHTHTLDPQHQHMHPINLSHQTTAPQNHLQVTFEILGIFFGEPSQNVSKARQRYLDKVWSILFRQKLWAVNIAREELRLRGEWTMVWSNDQGGGRERRRGRWPTPGACWSLSRTKEKERRRRGRWWRGGTVTWAESSTSAKASAGSSASGGSKSKEKGFFAQKWVKHMEYFEEPEMCNEEEKLSLLKN